VASAEAAEHFSRTYSVWTAARPQNDFAAVQPLLEKTLDLSLRYAGFFDTFHHPADAFIDLGDHGLSVAQIRPLFTQLSERLSPMVKSIAQQPKPRHDFLHRHYPKADQLAYGAQLAHMLGYDFTRGRLDTTAHPFMIKFAHGDVRITTRVNEQDLADNLFGVIHEVGHALYEQGVDEAYDATPLNQGTSSGVHESQSRLWENLVGRSLAFWEHSFGALQNAFPESLHDVSVDEFYRAINMVTPSLIRTDADEVTYNLHVIIRFDLECRMLEGNLSIADLPDAWHAAYEETLGVRAPSDTDGVLQDVHWFGSHIGGAFQGYALGNIISCQIFERALEENPNIRTHIARGELMPLLHWLQTNVYRYGSKYTTQQLLERLTGSTISLEPYFRYLQTKYGALYTL
jgi:carboxypeptidase Taq